MQLLDNGIFEKQITEVVINGKSPYSAKVTSGIPQESWLGRILFLLYINKILEVFIACMKLIAYDAKLSVCANNNSPN